MLTRSGYVIKKATHDIDAFELKKTLTVRPIENAVGITPPAFKVYKETKEHICVPRYFGTERYGAAKETRPEPARFTSKFAGILRDSTRQNEAFQKGVEAFESLWVEESFRSRQALARRPSASRSHATSASEQSSSSIKNS